MNIPEVKEPPLPVFDEKPVVNGVDDNNVERSRSPSPPLEVPAYTADAAYGARGQVSYSTSSVETNETYGQQAEDRQISQILKEANSVAENKIKVRLSMNMVSMVS